MWRDFRSPEIASGAVKLADFAAIVLISALVYVVYVQGHLGDYGDFVFYITPAALSACLFLICCQRMGAYDLKHISVLRWQLPRVVSVWCGSVSVLVIVAFAVKLSGTYSRGWVTLCVVGVVTFLIISRCAYSSAVARWARKGTFLRNVAVVGAGEVGKQFLEKLRNSPDSGVRIVGVFDDRKTRLSSLGEGVDLLGTTDDLLQVAQQTQVDEIIVALPLNAGQRLRFLLEKLKSVPADLRLSIQPLAQSGPLRSIEQIADVPLLQIADRPLRQWNGVIKTCEDMILGSLLLVVFAPAIVLIAAIIKFSPGPVFFAQDRFGFNNKTISVFKFRTMHRDNCDSTGAQRTIRNDPRVTVFGRFLRATSLDELPQLINVLKGEMSLVGPRAHPVAMMAGDRLYHEAVDKYVHRHRVKPGITGWAQVNQLRGEIDTLEKARLRVAYDLEYIEHWSLWFDLRIIFTTLFTIFRRENAY